jgi:hypothetical protein
MKVLARVLTGTVLATGLFSSVLQATSAFADDDKKVRHVLLLSVDGFHAVDLAICAAKGTCPNLEKLMRLHLHQRIDHEAFGLLSRPVGPDHRRHVEIDRRFL